MHLWFTSREMKTTRVPSARPNSVVTVRTEVEPRVGSQSGSDSMRDRIYEGLKHDIIIGRFQAGEALSEQFLANIYQGSRTPVREAAVRLEQENLIRIIPNRGYFVTHITINQLSELYEYRTVVEGACAEIAARKASDPAAIEELERVGAIEFTADNREAYERFIRADTAFHVGLAELTRNHLLIRAVKSLRAQMERIMYAAIEIHYYGETPAREHEQIIEALKKHDPLVARKRMLHHINVSRDKILQLANGNSRPL